MSLGANESDAAPAEPAPSAPAAPGAGFSARLTGTTLFDLIQLECQDRAHKVVRVSAGARAGLLFFRLGNVVHATDGRQTGEAAVQTLLGWSGGVFERVSFPWPERETITWPWQTLLLRAAHALDEAAESAGRPGPRAHDEPAPPNVLAFPRREPPFEGVLPSAPRVATHTRIEAAPRREGEDEVTKRTTTTMTGLDDDTPPVTVRISADGEVLGGDTHPTFAELAAFTVQIADLIGTMLGLSPVAAIDLAASRGAAVIVRAPNDDLVAVRAPARTDLSTLRERARMP